MARNLNICLEQFELFYTCLMKDAPESFIPWFFACEKNSKNPSPNAILKKDPTSKGSWHHTSARLNKQECIEHIKQGYNIGISARNEDELIIGDIDEVNYINQTPTNTLTNTSRKRDGRHFFGWNKDNTAKINLPTGKGEMRSQNQYVLSAGSYVEIDEKNYNQLTTEAQQDPLLGYYTVLTATTPRPLSFDDLPQFFKDKYQENKQSEIETNRRIEENKEPIKKEGKYTELFELSVSDIVGNIKANRRVGHPLHSSDTDANFSLSKDGKLGHCWRHLVSLNAVQFLCVESGYSQCEDAGTPHKGGTSKIKGDKKAIEEAYQQAIKDGYIKENIAKAPKGFARGGLKLDNYIDNVETFYNIQPFFYDKNGLFWFWNKEQYKYEIADEIDLMNHIEKELEFGGQTVANKIKGCYLEAFKRIGRQRKPKALNKNWIQFKNKIYDFKTKEIFEATPEWFATNPIPWEIGLNANTPTIDRLFTEWVGEQGKELLYQIIAYCCVSDYPIQVLFAFIGSGRNGKSKFLELNNRFIGKENVTSTELDDLMERTFERAKLYKKLVCVMGETNFTTIKRTGMLKKLTGGDLIGFEIKNKNPFDDYNYAKILISSNSLPSSDDTSDGFYRRWIIIHFKKEFPEGKDILSTIPEIEYNNLAKKVTEIIANLLDRGSFTNQGTIEERKEKYIKASNPLKHFIKECCDIKESGYVKYNELYGSYSQYLLKNKMRIVSKKEFSVILNQESYLVEKTSKNVDGEYVNGFWVFGLVLKPNQTNVTDVTDFDKKSLKPHPASSGNNIESHLSHQSQEVSDLSLKWDDVQSMLLDKPLYEMRVVDLVSRGVSENQLDQWKSDGLIFESRNGFVRLL